MSWLGEGVLFQELKGWPRTREQAPSVTSSTASGSYGRGLLPSGRSDEEWLSPDLAVGECVCVCVDGGGQDKQKLDEPSGRTPNSFQGRGMF